MPTYLVHRVVTYMNSLVCACVVNNVPPLCVTAVGEWVCEWDVGGCEGEGPGHPPLH